MTVSDDWADEIARRAFSVEVVQTWPRAGYCRKCNQPVGAWSIDLTKARTDYAAALRAARTEGAKESMHDEMEAT